MNPGGTAVHCFDYEQVVGVATTAGCANSVTYPLLFFFFFFL